MDYLRNEIAALGGPRVSNSDLAYAVGIQSEAYDNALKKKEGAEFERVQRAQAVTWSKKCSGNPDNLFTDSQIDELLNIISSNNGGRTIDRQTMIESSFQEFKQKCGEMRLGLLGKNSLSGFSFLDAACLDDLGGSDPRPILRIERPERPSASAAYSFNDDEEFEAGLDSVATGERVRIVLDNLDAFAPGLPRWLMVFFAFGAPLRQAATQIQAPAWLLLPSPRCPTRMIETGQSWVGVPDARDGTVRVENHPGRGSIYAIISTFDMLATNDPSDDGERLPPLTETALQRLTDLLAARPKHERYITRHDYEVVRR